MLLHGERVLLRVGLGQGRQQVEGPASVLAALGQGATGSAVTTRVPSLLAQGRAGAASWSLEQRMPGASPPLPFDAGLLDDCVEFLAVLHKAPCAAGQHGTDITSAAAGVGRLTRHGALVRRLAARAVENVHDLPRGFGHRDFWHRNLLAQDGRLTGVVDWDSAAGGTLPFLDLMHLVATQRLRPGGHMLGRALVEVLLPWAERGGDVHAERYAAALGVSTRAPQLRALVTVYWLEWLDYQLSHYAERRRDQRWLRGNVELVVDALAA